VAQLDGANHWQLFRHITLPLITPATVLQCGHLHDGALQVFDLDHRLTAPNTGGQATPAGLVLYCRDGLPAVQMGYASAIAITRSSST
jgi:ABC-type sugar transport system permease subunit